MTKTYVSSYQFPLSDDNGDMKGGGYWLSHDLNRFNNQTWKGIVIDAYGDLLGTTYEERQENIGITLWTDKGGTTPSHKDVQIFYNNDIGSGIMIYGGKSAWVSYNYKEGDETTYDGVFIDQNGVSCFEAAESISDHAKLRVRLNSAGINIFGGSLVWTPEGWVEGDKSTWKGFIISSESIAAYDGYLIEGEISPAFELKNTGYLTIGYPDGAHLICDAANDGIWTFGINIICTATDYVKTDPLTHNGVILNSSGLFGYEKGKERVRIKNDGSLIIKGGFSRWLNEDAIEDQPATWNGIVIYDKGIFGFKNTVDKTIVTLQLKQDGNIGIGKYDISASEYLTGTPHLDYDSDDGILLLQGGVLACTSTEFTPGRTDTYDGVVIDYNGIWACKDADIHLQIKNDGTFILGKDATNRLGYIPEWEAIVLQGVNIICACPEFEPGNKLTYDGVIINSNGIFSYLNHNKTVSIENNGNVCIGTIATGRLIYEDGLLALVGATICCLPAYFQQGELETYDGVIISSDGFFAYNNNIKTVEISNEGDFTFGTGTNRISFNAGAGTLSYAGFVTQTMTPINPGSNYTGVTVDSSGIKGYYNGSVIGGFSDGGNVYLGKTTDKSIVYTGSLDQIIIGKYVIITDSAGNYRQIGDVATRAYSAINSEGKITGEILGTTLIAGVLASTIAANASGGTVTMDTITDGSTYKKITSTEYSGYNYLSSILINRINSNGDAGFNNLSASASLTVSQLGGSGNIAVYANSSGTLIKSSSDKTLKKDIQSIKYGLKEILKLKPVEFYWQNQSKFGIQKEIGFIAQDVQNLIPELVSTNSDETLSLDYPKITSVLVRAIQDLCELLSIH